MNNKKEIIKIKADTRKHIRDIRDRGIYFWKLVKEGSGHGQLSPEQVVDLLEDFKLEFYVLNYQLVSYGETDCPLIVWRESCVINTPFICTSCLINLRENK